MIDVQVKEMTSMGEAIRKLESKRENSHSHEKMMEAYLRSNMENGKINVLHLNAYVHYTYI